MLISMPTCTSTIFGVFQVIPVSQVKLAQRLRRLNRKTAARRAQEAHRKVRRDLTQQPQQRASRRRAQLFCIQRAVAIWICSIEALLDDSEIFVERQCYIVVGISRGQLARVQTAGEFTSVERAVVIGIKL